MDEHERRAGQWLTRYAAAWREFDAGAVGALFADEVAYSFDPFAAPLDRDGVVAHWTAAFAGQASVALATRLVAAGPDGAAAEWWAAIVGRDGEESTLSASLLLRFGPDGRCRELHEHWLRRDGLLPAPARFG
jgi:ketosteroid isomerase-like protein